MFPAVTFSAPDPSSQLRGNSVVKLVPEQSVLKLRMGDRISLSAAHFEQLAEAFFADLEAKFL